MSSQRCPVEGCSKWLARDQRRCKIHEAAEKADRKVSLAGILSSPGTPTSDAVALEQVNLSVTNEQVDISREIARQDAETGQSNRDETGPSNPTLESGLSQTGWFLVASCMLRYEICVIDLTPGAGLHIFS